MSALVQQLKRLSPSRRRIQALFLSDGLIANDQNRDNDLAELARNFSQILAFASPFLISFAVHLQSQRGPSLIARIFRTPMPLLESLTISGLYPFPTLSTHFPRLRQLHIDGNRNPTGLFCSGVFRDAFPNLETLQVTGIERIPILFEIEDVIKRLIKEGEIIPDGENLGRLPSSLRTLAIQAGPLTDLQSNISIIKSEVLSSQLDLLRQKSTKGSIGDLKIDILDRQLNKTNALDIKTLWDLCST